MPRPPNTASGLRPGFGNPAERPRRFPAALLVFLIALPAVDFRPAPSPFLELAAAAEDFLGTLTPELRKKAQFAFDAPGRTSWGYVPGVREGVPMKDLAVASRRAVHALLRAILSAEGYLKATAIMNLENLLRELEAGGGPTRDPELYYVAVYGAPSADGRFGVRFEGHHLSLSVTVVDGREVVVAPLFLGANPAEVRTGPMTGLRVLATEEDLGRVLVSSLSVGSLKLALIAENAPPDILLTPSAKEGLGEPVGLAAGAMDEGQRGLLRRLVTHYAHTLRADLAEAELRRIEAAGFGAVHFAWAGGRERGQGHYYRIHGPTFAIEYDNTQNGANHIHTVWHDLQNDFGNDALRHHREEHHGGK